MSGNTTSIKSKFVLSCSSPSDVQENEMHVDVRRHSMHDNITSDMHARRTISNLHLVSCPASCTIVGSVAARVCL